ncbi:MAG: hypothetical protein GY823_12605 [Flavobacteriaceae bacterium]|nr:hypothetical protein [Flavobacteriaceae bacterium]
MVIENDEEKEFRKYIYYFAKDNVNEFNLEEKGWKKAMNKFVLMTEDEKRDYLGLNI